MGFYQVTIRGYPDKSNNDLTRLCFPVEAWEHRMTACDLVVFYGGFYPTEFKIVKEEPERPADEIVRGANIMAAYQNNREH
jgi:hypothetical protein